MTISELIERLEALKAEHGDLGVFAADGVDPNPSFFRGVDNDGEIYEEVWL